MSELRPSYRQSSFHPIKHAAAADAAATAAFVQ